MIKALAIIAGAIIGITSIVSLMIILFFILTYTDSKGNKGYKLFVIAKILLAIDILAVSTIIMLSIINDASD